MSLNRKGGMSVTISNTPLTTSNATAEVTLTTISNQPGSNIAIGSGQIPGWSEDTMTGYREGVSVANNFEIIVDANLSGLPISFPSNTAEKFSVASTSANDTAAGSGAITLLIIGLDTNKEPQLDVVALNGLTPVLTNLDFTRINRALVFSSGATESNEGTIYFSSEGGSWSSGIPTTVVYNIIVVGTGYTQTAIYTTPLNVTNTVIGNVIVSANVVGTNEVKIYVESRRPDPGSAWLRTSNIPISTGTTSFNIQGAGFYSPGTDIRLRASASSENTDIQTFFLLYHYTAQ